MSYATTARFPLSTSFLRLASTDNVLDLLKDIYEKAQELQICAKDLLDNYHSYSNLELKALISIEPQLKLLLQLINSQQSSGLILPASVVATVENFTTRIPTVEVVIEYSSLVGPIRVGVIKGVVSTETVDVNMPVYYGYRERSKDARIVEPIIMQPRDSLQKTLDVAPSANLEKQKVMEIDLNEPLESFRGREKELYEQIFKEKSPANIKRIIYLLFSLNSTQANTWLEKLFFLETFQEEKTNLSESVEAIGETLFNIFPHLAELYNKESREKLVGFVERILDGGTSKAQEICIIDLLSMRPSLNGPDLTKPLLKFSYETFKSDPIKSKLAMKVAEKYVEETEIRQYDSGKWGIEFKLKSVV